MSNNTSVTGIKRFFAIITLALFYVIMARLGLLFAINPGYETAIWPASGIAVAGLLLFGYSVWPGIFLGSFITNLFIIPDIGTSFLISLGIAIGSTLQPLVLTYILKKLMCICHLLNTHRNIFIF